MSYEEATTTRVSKAQALAEIARHGCDGAAFLAELGDHATYRGADVLAWLGY